MVRDVDSFLTMYKVVVILCLCWLSTSCVHILFTPSSITKKNLDICYDGGSTGLESVLKIQGYFWKHVWIYDDQGELVFSDTTELVFLRDGTCIVEIVSDSTELRGVDYINTRIARGQDISGYYTGIYQVNNDTITMQILSHVTFGNFNPWEALESKYLILNDTTIKFIESTNLTESQGYPWRTTVSFRTLNSVARFVPLDTLPTYDMWVREKKYFWCEDAWPGRKAVKGLRYKSPTSIH